jgi:hypothetical protein
MVMRGIFLNGWAYRQPPSHAEMNYQDPIGMKTNEQIFRTPVYSRNRTINRFPLQSPSIYHMAQLRLPHPHAGNRPSDKPWL